MLRKIEQLSMIFVLYGRVAERPIASVLKTEDLKGSGGSNPSSSDTWDDLTLQSLIKMA